MNKSKYEKMYRDTLLVKENLKDIIDGKNTVKEVAEILGMGYQTLSLGNVNIKDIYKALGYTQDDIESLVEESMSPLEKLLSRAFPSVKGVLIDTVEAEDAILLMLENKLTKEEFDVIKSRYGLDDKEPKTLSEIGKAMGMKPERVRQIEAKVLRKLIHPNNSHYLKAVVIGEVGELEDVEDFNNELARTRVELEKVRAENLYLKKVLHSNPEIDIECGVLSETYLETPIEDIELSVRTYNCLKRAGKNTLGDISSMTIDELKNIRGVNESSIIEVESLLKQRGLSLLID